MQDVTNLVSLLFIACDSVTLLHFSHYWSNRTSPSFASTMFQNFLDTSDLLSEVPKFQHCTNLYSKFITFLVSMVINIKFMQIGGLVQCNLVVRYHSV